LGPHAEVQRTDRLIADQNAGAHGQRPGNCRALPLTARQFARIATGRGGGQADIIQQMQNLAVAVRACGLADNLQRLGDCLANSLALVHRGKGVLKYILDFTPSFSKLSSPQLRQVISAIQDLTRFRLSQPDDGAAQCGLAAATFAVLSEELWLSRGGAPG